jgi:hypothetical protein
MNLAISIPKMCVCTILTGQPASKIVFKKILNCQNVLLLTHLLGLAMDEFNSEDDLLGTTFQFQALTFSMTDCQSVEFCLHHRPKVFHGTPDDRWDHVSLLRKVCCPRLG